MLTLVYLLAIPVIAAAIGYALGYAAIHLKVDGDPLVDEISALLPNGQWAMWLPWLCSGSESHGLW